ncbi:cation:proton antiporter domain-containing protein [Mycobacterium sp. BMJ-28]
MHTGTALALTVLVLMYAVISGLVNRWYLAPALVFILMGMVLGPFGFDVIAADDTRTFNTVAQLALSVILFNQAASLDLAAAVRRGHATFRLLIVGIPLALALGTVTALVLLPVLPVWEAVCLAAVVAPTEVALIDALLEDQRIPERVRHALSVESGCYDGFALAAALAALALASERSDGDLSRWGWFLVHTELVSLLMGAAIGVAGGAIIMASRRRNWMNDTWAQLATVAMALVCFGIAERVHASGFVAAFVGGLGYAAVARHADSQVPTQVSDAVGQVLELVVFAIFGGYAIFLGWRETDWRTVLFCVVALLLVRPIAVQLALLRTDVPMRSRLFIGWFGPRGIGTLVLGLLVIGHGEMQNSATITQAVVITVTLSLLLHSLTTWPGIRFVAPDRLASEPRV